jgi:hypothetical protein
MFFPTSPPWGGANDSQTLVPSKEFIRPFAEKLRL